MSLLKINLKHFFKIFSEFTRAIVQIENGNEIDDAFQKINVMK